MKWGSETEFVMPGLVPGIHVLASFEQERRGWPGRSPTMTKVNHFQVVRNSLKMLDAFSFRLSGCDAQFALLTLPRADGDNCGIDLATKDTSTRRGLILG
jgi:hypothetical protein